MQLTTDVKILMNALDSVILFVAVVGFQTHYCSKFGDIINGL